MVVNALIFAAGAQSAEPPPPHPDLAVRLRYGLMAGPVLAPVTVQIAEVRLFPQVAGMTPEALAAALQGEEWFPVGILETRAHGRMRLTCHLDTCIGAANGAEAQIRLLDQPPAEDHRRPAP